MPYKSKAQEGKFHELLKEGKISKKVVDEFDRSSKGKVLPERVKIKTSHQATTSILNRRKP